jgi:hypothetical protein
MFCLIWWLVDCELMEFLCQLMQLLFKRPQLLVTCSIGDNCYLVNNISYCELDKFSNHVWFWGEKCVASWLFAWLVNWANIFWTLLIIAVTLWNIGAIEYLESVSCSQKLQALESVSVFWVLAWSLLGCRTAHAIFVSSQTCVSHFKRVSNTLAKGDS